MLASAFLASLKAGDAERAGVVVASKPCAASCNTRF